MKTTRQGVFETNSSSTHSVTIVGGREKQQFDGDLFVVRRGDFGWEYRNYSDFETKCSYAYTIAANLNFWTYGEKNKPEFYEDDNSSQLWMLRKVLKEELGVDKVAFLNNDGHVDHQSQDLVYDIFESEETLKDFLFSPYSSVTTDNDNH